MTAEDNFKNLCNLTTKLLGLPDGSLSLKSRKQDLQIGRSVAGVISRMEDDTHRTIIAKVLDRDRSLVYHYEKQHKGNYANWGAYRNAFNKVYVAYQNMVDTKKTFLDDDFMKSYLLKNDVKENLKAQVLIEVKSGKAICLIKTSYFDFSNQLENIKFVLSNYHYEIKIK